MTSMPPEYRIGRSEQQKQENIMCPRCEMDSGVPNTLSMTIPTEGLYCQHCENVVVLPSITTIN
jgi:transcription elongation factor Elf1